MTTPVQPAGPANDKDKSKKGAGPGGEDEIQYFETTVTKLVERENEDGDTEVVEVMSDNLYPGEKLKREADEETADHKDELARAQSHDAAEKRRASEDEILKNKRSADSKAK